MNNRQNNSTAIILILIMMMISSMMSSSAGILGFNLFTAIRPSKEVTRQIKTQENRVDALAKQAGVDGEKFRKDMNEEILKKNDKKACGRNDQQNEQRDRYIFEQRRKKE